MNWTYALLMFAVLANLVVQGPVASDNAAQEDPPILKKTEDAETQARMNRRERMKEKYDKIHPDDPPGLKMHKNMMRQGRMNEKERILEQYSKSGQFESSYKSTEVKENMDFVLTPALLVQEVLAEDVVPTYPRE